MIRGRKFSTLLGTALIAALICGPLATTANADTDPGDVHGDGFKIAKVNQAPEIPYGTSAYGNPDSVDLRAWAVASGDQGSLNSCVSWALGYTILGWYANKMGTPTTFAPMYIYSQTHLNNSYDGGGSYVRDAMGVVRNKGVDTIDDYQPQGNYNFTDAPTATQHANAAAYKTLGLNDVNYNRLYVSASGNVGGGAQSSIEASLAAGRPVGLAVPIYESFYYVDNDDYNYTNAEATGSLYGYHYMGVLGYDSTGVWAQNSWGTWWGQHGFVHLDWAFVNTKSVEAESVYGFAASSLPQPTTQAPDPTPTPTPTPTSTATPVVTPTPSAEPSTTPTAEPTTPVVTPTAEPTTPVVTPTAKPTTPVVIPTTAPSVEPTQTVIKPTVPVVTPPQSVPTQNTVPNQPVVVNPPPVHIIPADPAQVPAAPGRAATAAANTTSLSLRWNTPTNNGGADITGYQVSIANGSWSRVLATTGTTALFTGLTANTVYTVNIRAVNSAGYSNPSVSTVETNAAAPKIAKVSVKTARGAITTAWQAQGVGRDKVVKTVILIKQGSKTIAKKTYKANVKKATVKLKGNAKQAYKMSITVYAQGGKHITNTRTIRLR